MDSQLKKGLLEVCVLSALKDGASYGYKIINELLPVVEISESTLYTILKRLEANDCVTTFSREESGRLRKYYALTQSGNLKIDEFINCREEFNKIISFITERRDKNANEN